MQPSHSQPSAIQSPPKRRRRWWFYALWTFGTLVTLAGIAFLSLVIYWNSLVKTYTSTSPKPVPTVEVTDEAYDELKQRWDAYVRLFIRRNQTIPPFELSANELNMFASRFGPFRKQAFVEVLDNRLRLQFSFPLDRTGNPTLKGRFLNGIATFTPAYTNNHLVIRLEKAEANGKAIPRWIFRRFERVNWGEALNRRPEFDLAFKALERIEVHPDGIVLHPIPNPSVR